MNINSIKPNRDFYNLVRAGFTAQGSSLTKWCKNEDINAQTAISCLVGTWDGPKARKLRARLVEAAGVEQFLAITEKSDDNATQKGAA